MLLDVYGPGLSIAQLHLKMLNPLRRRPPLHWCLMRAALSVHPTSRQQHHKILIMSRAVRPLLFTSLPPPPPLRLLLTRIIKSMMAMMTTIARTKTRLPSHLLPLTTPPLRLPPPFRYLMRKTLFLPKLATGFGPGQTADRDQAAMTGERLAPAATKVEQSNGGKRLLVSVRRFYGEFALMKKSKRPSLGILATTQAPLL